MQLPKHLKQYRLDAGLSQEDLARRIFVTRQTISNWERGKTYPDIQSLLLLSEQLDVTIDELVKGDISIIRERVERDRGTLYRLGAGMLAGLLAFTVSMAWLMWQQNYGWGMVQCVPTMVLAGVFGAGAMCCALAAEHIKKKNDLVTYQEISDFLDGKKADSEETRTGWAYEHPQLANAIKFAAAALIGLIVFELVNAAMSHF